MADKLRELLTEVGANPNRPDNPVRDFLGRTSEPREQPVDVQVFPEEVAAAQPLAGPGAEGLDAVALARSISRRGHAQDYNTILRLTRGELSPLMTDALDGLNRKEPPANVQSGEIQERGTEYIVVMEPLTRNVEEFVLTSIEEGSLPGTALGLRLAGDWISLSQQQRGRTIKFAQGTPALLAWRLLVWMGASALENEAFDSPASVLRDPIETEDMNRTFGNQSILQRRKLFHPETFLGGADLGFRYLDRLWENNTHLEKFFTTEQHYQFSVAKFLLLVALLAPVDKSGYPLYPGYRLSRQAQRAMSSLCSRLASSNAYLEEIARAAGESASQFRESWVRPRANRE